MAGEGVPQVKIDRIERDITAISQFGSEPDMQARQWLRDKFEALGMAHRMDGAGNVIGRYPKSGLLSSPLDGWPQAQS